MADMSKVTFHVLYDGPALASNEMDVRDLAPALLALGAVLEEANSTLNDSRAKIAVKVRASFKTGCFGIELDVLQSFSQQLQVLFSSEHIASAKQILEWIGLIAGGVGSVTTVTNGLLGLLKWLRGRKINRVVLLDNGLVRVELNEEHIEIERQIIDLYRQFRLRKALEGVLKPLEKDGIDEFAVTNKEQTERFVAISKADAVYFASPDAEVEILSEEEVEMNLQLVNIAFREDNKWRFSDGSTAFYAQVLDQDFLRQVQGNEPFSSGDILKAKLRRTQLLSGDAMKTEYTLLEVLEHRRAGVQLPMQFDREQPEQQNRPKP